MPSSLVVQNGKREGRPGERDKRNVAVAVNGYGLAELYSRLFSSVGLESSRRQVHRERRRCEDTAPLTLSSPPDPSCRGLCYRSASGGILKSRGASHTLGSTLRHVQPCGSSASRVVRHPPRIHTLVLRDRLLRRCASLHLRTSFDVRGEISPTTAKKKKIQDKYRGQCKRISASELFSYILFFAKDCLGKRRFLRACDFRYQICWSNF